MPNHVRSLIFSMLKDYERSIKNALEEKGEARKKNVKEADEAHYLIKNLILEYKK